MADTITNIPSARMRFLKDDGTVEPVWFRFLLSLFNLTGGGQSSATVEDLLINPTDTTSVDQINAALDQFLVNPQNQSLPAEEKIDAFPQIDVSYLQSQIDALSLVPTPTNVTFASTAGTATSASVLSPGRNINGVLFDGSANITVTAAAGTLTGSTLASGVTASSLTSVGTIATGVWQGTLVGVTYGGTGTSTTFTSGSVLFAGSSGVYSQNNSKFYWDNTNNRLGIGTTSPVSDLHVSGSSVTQIRLTGGSGAGNGAYIGFTAQGANCGYIGNEAAIQGGGTSNSFTLYSATGNAVKIQNGDLSISDAGKGLVIKTGANCRLVTATLVAGTVTVANTSVTANTLVFPVHSTTGGTVGVLTSTKIVGTSFTVNSSSATDTSTINVLLLETS